MHYKSYLRNLPLFFILVSVFLSASLNFLYAQSKEALETEKQIDELLTKYYNAEQFMGSILVADQGKVIFKKGYGYANIEWDIPNSPETKFRLGSITKQFTSMLIMQLVEKGKINLDDKLIDFLPYYRKDVGQKVTIHQLLNHTSGIPSYTNREDFSKYSKLPYAPDEFIKLCCSGDLEFEPGTSFRYNNSGYFILGAIIEKVTGMPYEEALKKNILEPLSMNNTGYDHHESIIKNRAVGYENRFGSYTNSEYLDMSLPYAAGSLYSTVEDLYKWDQALYTDKLLSDKFKEILFKPSLENYAYGWFIGETEIEGKGKFKTISHNGGINGFVTRIFRLPEKKQLVILLSNTSSSPLNPISDALVNIINGINKYKEPQRSLARILFQKIDKEGIDKALAFYSEMKKDPAYKNTEAEINALGYGLMSKNRFDEAGKIFELNIKENPSSSNVYDSMGELCMKTGKNERSIEFYKKSLELDPENANAVLKLKQLGVEASVAMKPEIKLKPEILSRYVGRYQLAPQFILTITTEGERIFAQATGQPKVEIFASSETEFFLKVVKASLSFSLDEKGNAKSLTLTQNGQSLPANKIE